MKKLLNKKGFTLIELIVVIAILAILALILVPSIANYVNQATTARDQANARTVLTELALEFTVAGFTVDDEAQRRGCTVNTVGDADGVTSMAGVESVTCGTATVNND